MVQPRHGLPDERELTVAQSSLYMRIVKLKPVTFVTNDLYYLFKSGAYYLFNISYSFLVSSLYGAFSFRRGGSDSLAGGAYAFSSFSMNAPAAWFFTEEAINLVKQVWYKDWVFRSVFGISLGLSLLTTFAAFKVSLEAVERLEDINHIGWMVSEGFVPQILTFLMLINILMSRLVGCVVFVEKARFFVIDTYQRYFGKFAPYYRFKDDLEQYGHVLNIKIDRLGSKIETLNRYREVFYSDLQERNIRPGFYWQKLLRDVVYFGVTAFIIGVIMINMMPLWIHLTEKGAESIAKFFHKHPFPILTALTEFLSQSRIYISIASASNELFYLYSSILFTSRVHLFYVHAFKNIQQKLSCIFSNTSKTRAMIVTSVVSCLLAFSVVSGTFSYLSGAGYGQDAKEAVSNNDFGKMAHLLWFSWMGWWTNLSLPIYPFIIQFAAGCVVNGGAFLAFCSKRVPLIKPAKNNGHGVDSDKAIECIDEMIKEGSFDLELSGSIVNDRKYVNAKPSWCELGVSLWHKISPVKEYESELLPSYQGDLQINH